jgi:hypothetical protein
MGLHEQEAHVKIAQAVAEFRTEGPPELRPFLDGVATVTASQWEAAGTHTFTQTEIDAMVDPIIQQLRAEFEESKPLP